MRGNRITPNHSDNITPGLHVWLLVPKPASLVQVKYLSTFAYRAGDCSNNIILEH